MRRYEGSLCMSKPESLACLEVRPLNGYRRVQITPVASAAGRGAAGRWPQLFLFGGGDEENEHVR